MNNMSDKERINLEKLINDKNVEQTTEKIRQLKHSSLIKKDIQTVLDLKKKYSRLNKDTIHNMAVNKCNFLYKNYTNIFNKLLDGYLDLNILGAFVEVLRRIEEGKIDQHQGSYEIGSLLKELYIDSALKKDKTANKNTNKPYKKVKNNINWKDFKTLNNLDD